MADHGTTTMYRLNCRCDECRAVKLASGTAYRRRKGIGPKRAREPKHGTANEYRNHGCRCASCSAANTEYHRAYWQRKLAKHSDGEVR